LVVKLAGASDPSQGVSMEVAQTLKTCFISIQSLGLVIGILIFVYYPITRARSAEIRKILNDRAKV
jgi:Na+/melibiose symporter-like transporter